MRTTVAAVRDEVPCRRLLVCSVRHRNGSSCIYLHVPRKGFQRGTGAVWIVMHPVAHGVSGLSVQSGAVGHTRLHESLHRGNVKSMYRTVPRVLMIHS